MEWARLSVTQLPAGLDLGMLWGGVGGGAPTCMQSPRHGPVVHELLRCIAVLAIIIAPAPIYRVDTCTNLSAKQSNNGGWQCQSKCI